MATATGTALQQLTEFCEMTYGVPRYQTRILVSTYLPTRYMPVWLLIDAEKCRFLEDFEYVVMKLGYMAILDTWYLRQRAHLANRYVKVLVNAREKPQLFANRYWQWPGPTLTPRSMYPLLMAECLRLRLEFDVAKQPGELVRDELYALVRRALAEAKVDRGGVVPLAVSETFCRRASLLPMIDRHWTSLTTLMRNFGLVAANHAALSGRIVSDANEDDESAQRQMLRMAIPVWAAKILLVIMRHGAFTLRWKEIIEETRQAYDWQWVYSGTNITTVKNRMQEKTIRNLWQSGLLERNRNHRFYLKEQYAEDLDHILKAMP